MVSVQRLTRFFSSDELQPDARNIVFQTDLHAGDVVSCPNIFHCVVRRCPCRLQVLEIKDGEFTWTTENPSPTLEGISLTVKKGELVGIYGRVGAGKVYSLRFSYDLSDSIRQTSLVSAIIGDMRKLEGQVNLYGTVAYSCQNPWIMSATIRDNILFSHEYDEDFYNLVLDGSFFPDYSMQ